MYYDTHIFFSSLVTFFQFSFILFALISFFGSLPLSSLVLLKIITFVAFGSLFSPPGLHKFYNFLT